MQLVHATDECLRYEYAMCETRERAQALIQDLRTETLVDVVDICKRFRHGSDCQLKVRSCLIGDSAQLEEKHVQLSSPPLHDYDNAEANVLSRGENMFTRLRRVSQRLEV